MSAIVSPFCKDSSSCRVLTQCCLEQAKEKTSDLAGTAQDKAHSAAGTAQACPSFFCIVCVCTFWPVIKVMIVVGE